jgi:tetratricopeptide (TPR) repeat protein
VDEDDYEEAIRYYSRALLHNRNNIRVLVARGHAYYRLGHYDLALEDFNRALEREPDDGRALAWRAEVYRTRGGGYFSRESLPDFRRAVRDLNRALKHDPDNIIALRVRDQYITSQSDIP